jgi:hypothetical protein
MFYYAEAFDQDLRVDSSNGEQSKWNKLDDSNSNININYDCFCEGVIMCGDPKFDPGCNYYDDNSYD